MERGDSFSYLDYEGDLQSMALATNPRGGGKPPHRIRNRYNYIRPIIEEKVSAATQRVPGYEIDPSTADPEDAGAAKLARRSRSTATTSGASGPPPSTPSRPRSVSAVGVRAAVLRTQRRAVSAGR
jgi:hypothetical protein